jgi:transposase
MSPNMARRTYPYKLRPNMDKIIYKLLLELHTHSISEIAQASTLSTSSIRKYHKPYDEGGVRYPRHESLSKLATAAGYEFKLVKTKE